MPCGAAGKIFIEKIFRNYVTNFLAESSEDVNPIDRLNECTDILDCFEDGNCTDLKEKVEQIANFIPKDRKKTMYVAMACYGEYDISQLSPYEGKSIDGIRVTFHYNEVAPALEYCQEIM